MNSEELAWKIRRHVIEMTHEARASHVGGALSAADIIAVLYADVLKYDIRDPEWAERDRVILSKGHNGSAMYAALAECGFFPVDMLHNYGKNGSNFSCHISHKNVPGVEISSGSLGHGVCVACGMALNGKIRNKPYRVYSIVGDGECNEGAVWEMALLASKYKLDNYTVIVDRNRMQGMGYCQDVLNTEPFADKWKAFGWHVVEVADGNQHEQLKRAFKDVHKDKPRVIIAHTIKGCGISFMENQLLWHYRDPQGEDYENAVKELEEKRK